MKNLTCILFIVGAATGCMDVDLLDDMVVRATDSDPAVIRSDVVVAEDTDLMTPAAGPPPVDTADIVPPVLVTTCNPFETAVSGTCVIDGRSSLYVRLVTDEAVSITASSETVEILSAPWQLVHELILSKQSTAQQVTFTIADVNGNVVAVTMDVSEILNPAVVIIEVMADCDGPEPEGEYVKIANVGSVDVDLAGWMIDDNGDQNGDYIPEGTVLATGGVATIAMTGFAAAEAMLIPLESSIGSAGLKNSESESIQLFDGAGETVDEYQNSDQAPKSGVPYMRRHKMLPMSAPGLWIEKE